MAPRPSGPRRRYSPSSSGGAKAWGGVAPGAVSAAASSMVGELVELELGDEGPQRHADQIGGLVADAPRRLQGLDHTGALEGAHLLVDGPEARRRRARGRR